MSQQNSEDYDYSAYPEFPPPPKSAKPKALPEIPPTRIKPSPSLPPTPIRMQHHSARRTGSLEYQEPSEEPYYNDPRTKNNGYNEDYNYAYQSTDNLLPAQAEPVIVNDEVSEVRTSGRRSRQKIFKEEVPYYYQEEIPPDEKIEEQQSLSRRDTIKKQFQNVRRLESPRLLQQNTDSLESREDDDLRDSFETALSSVSDRGRSNYPEFIPVSESSAIIGPPIPERNSGSRNGSILPIREPSTVVTSSPAVTPTYQNSRPFLQTQISVDSYVDEEILGDPDYSHDSPISVVDRYVPEPVNSLIEPYRPLSPSKVPSPSPPLIDDDEEEEDDEPLDEEEPLEDISSEQRQPFEEQKVSSFDNEEQTMDQPPERRRMSAKERWHWAYNKIIHQLTVSYLFIFEIFLIFYK